MGVRRVYLGAAAAIGAAVAPVAVPLALVAAGATGEPPPVVVAADRGFGSGKGVPLPALDNPRSPSAAVAWAREQVDGDRRWSALCLNFIAHAYGWAYSGTHFAIDHYRRMPASMRHPGDRNPPAGALLFWDTGRRAGHVALGLGGGMVASNDIEVPGGISVVPADAITESWGARYVGWTAPYFPDAGTDVEPQPEPAVEAEPAPAVEAEPATTPAPTAEPEPTPTPEATSGADR